MSQQGPAAQRQYNKKKGVSLNKLIASRVKGGRRKGAEGVNQQVGVESEKETQNVPAVGAWDVGEQLDYGWEPRGKGQGQG